MRNVDIGVLRAPQIKFDLIGNFASDVPFLEKENTVSVAEGSLCLNGVACSSINFQPQDTDSLFVLHDVVIGVGFHWQRRENQTFRGALLFIIEDGEVRAVNRLPVEDYLESVISSEMSATSSMEFLKAHTVISRSWLYAQLARRKRVEQGVLGWENKEEIVRWYAREDHTLFDFCADDHCQRYQGITRAVNPNVARAVRETCDIVLMYDGEVCDARFSKCCGGVTERFSACWENEDYGYLQAFRDAPGNEPLPDLTTEEGAREWLENVPSSYCSTDDQKVLSQILNGYDRETNDFYRWKVEYSQDELSALLSERSGIDFGKVIDLQPVERAASGRIVRLRVVGSKRTVTVGKELEIRRWLSKSHLYSSAFVVDTFHEGNSVRFRLKGAGWGHGVGLCQIGAAMMGEKGCSYSQILEHYYPGALLEKIDASKEYF
ncbi:MAG: SpoIID/LytB domain-containing protein [Bacteroidaceae bacterium]|nr:SpoIID/LytB domain-containing protein [Bacteroidaceae bacterium]